MMGYSSDLGFSISARKARVEAHLFRPLALEAIHQLPQWAPELLHRATAPHLEEELADGCRRAISSHISPEERLESVRLVGAGTRCLPAAPPRHVAGPTNDVPGLRSERSTGADLRHQHLGQPVPRAVDLQPLASPSPHLIHRIQLTHANVHTTRDRRRICKTDSQRAGIDCGNMLMSPCRK